MTAGQSFVKAIKPFGCVLFLILFAVFMVIFFRLLTALRTAAGTETK